MPCCTTFLPTQKILDSVFECRLLLRGFIERLAKADGRGSHRPSQKRLFLKELLGHSSAPAVMQPLSLSSMGVNHWVLLFWGGFCKTIAEFICWMIISVSTLSSAVMPSSPAMWERWKRRCASGSKGTGARPSSIQRWYSHCFTVVSSLGCCWPGRASTRRAVQLAPRCLAPAGTHDPGGVPTAIRSRQEAWQWSRGICLHRRQTINID